MRASEQGGPAGPMEQRQERERYHASRTDRVVDDDRDVGADAAPGAPRSRRPGSGRHPRSRRGRGQAQEAPRFGRGGAQGQGEGEEEKEEGQEGQWRQRRWKWRWWWRRW